jgi:imidazolonepropionase-like amidohydrolase
MISQTSGHGDFRMRYEIPRYSGNDISHVEEAGISAIAEGPDEVLRRVREQLLLGASQIKIMTGGGVSSAYDPIDVNQFTAEEIRALVNAASDWRTYVCTHVYTPDGIKRALQNGVKCIEHGQLADEDAVKMMADTGAWWSLQPFLADEDSNPKSGPVARQQQQEIAKGTVRAYDMSRKHGIKTGFGTDVLFNPKSPARRASNSPSSRAGWTTSTCCAWRPDTTGSCLPFPVRAIPIRRRSASSRRAPLPISW